MCFLNVQVCFAYVYICIPCVHIACGGQEKVSDSLELKLRMVVSHYVDAKRTKPGSSAKAVSAFNCHLSSPAFNLFIKTSSMYIFFMYIASSCRTESPSLVPLR